MYFYQYHEMYYKRINFEYLISCVVLACAPLRRLDNCSAIDAFFATTFQGFHFCFRNSNHILGIFPKAIIIGHSQPQLFVSIAPLIASGRRKFKTS